MLRLRGVAGLGTAAVAALLMAGCERAAEDPHAAPPEATADQPADAPIQTALVFPTTPLIDPNTATETELSAVAGLGASAVAAVLAGRPFATPSELHAVIGEGLSEEDRKLVYQLMFVRVNLNSGAEEDFKLIPSSMSPGKLAHEFEEYRPYESIEEFQQEMAKYVSDEEVAYLARYVTID